MTVGYNGPDFGWRQGAVHCLKWRQLTVCHRHNREVADVLRLEQRSHSVRFLELKKDLRKMLPVSDVRRVAITGSAQEQVRSATCLVAPWLQTRHWHFGECGSHPWLRNWHPACHVAWLKNKLKKFKKEQILKEISPECSLKGLMLQLKLQYFGHLMRRTDSLEKTLVLGKNEGGRRRGRQRMRWLDDITDPMDMSLSKLRELVKGSLACCSSWGRRVRHNWATELNWRKVPAMIKNLSLRYLSLFYRIHFSGFWCIHKLVQPISLSNSRTFHHPPK